MKDSIFSQYMMPLLLSIVLLWNFIPVLFRWKKGEMIQTSIKALAVFGTIGASIILVAIAIRLFL